MHQETFETPHASLRQWLDLARIAGNDCAPRSPIDAAIAVCRLPFLLESRNLRRRRNAVQRHVNQQGIATRSRRSRRGVKSLPLGAAGLVDVNVRVHQSRQQRRFPEIVARRVRRHFTCRRDRTDSFSVDQHRSRTDSLRGHDSARNKRLQISLLSVPKSRLAR
jgi:hypothetical protein